MHSMRHMMRRPTHFLENMSDELMAGGRKITQRPMSAGGILLVVLGIVGFIWIFPELRRYLRIERM